MPLVHIPGEAQVDFGKAAFYEGNELSPIATAATRSGSSWTINEV